MSSGFPSALNTSFNSSLKLMVWEPGQVYFTIREFGPGLIGFGQWKMWSKCVLHMLWLICGPETHMNQEQIHHMGRSWKDMYDRTVNCRVSPWTSVLLSLIGNKVDVYSLHGVLFLDYVSRHSQYYESLETNMPVSQWGLPFLFCDSKITSWVLECYSSLEGFAVAPHSHRMVWMTWYLYVDSFRSNSYVIVPHVCLEEG